MQKQLWSPPILAEQFELKHSLINIMTSDQFLGLEKDKPHDHIRTARRWLEKESTRSIHNWEDLVFKFINEFFPPSRTTNLRNEISNFQQRFDESFHEAWDRYKDLLRACPLYGFTKLHQLDTFYNALNPADKDSLNAAAGGNLLERRTQDVLMIIENKSKGNSVYRPPEEDERVEETLTDHDLFEYTIKDDLQFDVEFDLKEIEFPLHQDIYSSLKDSIDQSNLTNPANNFVDFMPEMFADEQALDYSSPPIFDEYDDDFLEGEKIKESKLLIDELDLPCEFIPPFEYDSFISHDFSRVNA
nr:reverse transcriptase domain-containing protein [Tanacetum cinerariifolium]